MGAESASDSHADLQRECSSELPGGDVLRVAQIDHDLPPGLEVKTGSQLGRLGCSATTTTEAA